MKLSPDEFVSKVKRKELSFTPLELQMLKDRESMMEEEQQFHFLVIGNTNVGKSTIINKLLGRKRVLKQSPLTETKIFWIVEVSSRTDYRVLFKERPSFVQKKPIK